MRESKSERFCRIAPQRTQKVLDALVSLRRCSSTIGYEYTQEQVEQILTAIEKEVQGLRNSFEGKPNFSFAKKTSDKN